MLLKSAVLAAVLAAAAAGSATAASATSRGAHGYWGGHSNYGHHRIHRTYTTTRCIGSRRVLMRINHWGHVVSRRVVGRCWYPYLRRHWF
ncbi:MAG: hypothetical protein KJZ80_20230 [Hyphomicrobiaceae bacterium]|nr:hypothetical protein [Hyphomicrobiaceae bacterium]